MYISFRGGIHPKGHKELSREAALRHFDPSPGEMVFPLSQHIGKPAKAIVRKNDPVLVGQKLAEADGFVSACVISSCSGTVKAVEKRRTIAGTLTECVVVENDGRYTPIAGLGTRQDPSTLSGEEILARVRDAGIIGLGGAGFPTHVKLAPKAPEQIRWLIANGAECEPYISCNDQLMRSHAAGIVEGLEIALRLFPNAECVIGIERNKPQAIASMRQAVSGKARMRILPLHTKYPQGGEHSLIRAITGVDFPVSMLPAELGCIVLNVGTAYAVGRAVAWNEPLYEHVLTVSGEAVRTPSNFIARDGTSLAQLLEACGGIREGVTLKKALSGGPMMGIAVASLELPIQKNTNALTLLAEDPSELAQTRMTACLHCGRCSTVCPNGLVPALMADAIHMKNWARYEKKLYGLDCIACGCCTYICPARRPLTQMFKQTKAEIMARKRAEQTGGRK